MSLQTHGWEWNKADWICHAYPQASWFQSPIWEEMTDCQRWGCAHDHCCPSSCTCYLPCWQTDTKDLDQSLQHTAIIFTQTYSLILSKSGQRHSFTCRIWQMKMLALDRRGLHLGSDGAASSGCNVFWGQKRGKKPPHDCIGIHARLHFVPLCFCQKKLKQLSNPKSPQTICLFSAATTHQLLDLHQEKLLGPEGEEGRSVHTAAYRHVHHIQTRLFSA